MLIYWLTAIIAVVAVIGGTATLVLLLGRRTHSNRNTKISVTALGARVDTDSQIQTARVDIEAPVDNGNSIRMSIEGPVDAVINLVKLIAGVVAIRRLPPPSESKSLPSGESSQADE